MAMEFAVSSGLGSGSSTAAMASGDLARDDDDDDRLAELARRERDCDWRGPTLEERREGVEDFLNKAGVADRDSLPVEGLRGVNLELAAGAGDASDVEEFLNGVVRSGDRVALVGDASRVLIGEASKESL